MSEVLVYLIFFENSIFIGTLKGYVSAKLIELNLFQIVETIDCFPSTVKDVLFEEDNKTAKTKRKKIRALKKI